MITCSEHTAAVLTNMASEINARADNLPTFTNYEVVNMLLRSAEALLDEEPS